MIKPSLFLFDQNESFSLPFLNKMEISKAKKGRTAGGRGVNAQPASSLDETIKDLVIFSRENRIVLTRVGEIKRFEITAKRLSSRNHCPADPFQIVSPGDLIAPPP